MFEAIVVDDEMTIRNGISSFINNSDTGFEVVKEFKDGSEVIDFLRDNDVDLVISDIKMVNVSGIDVAKYIYENKPYIKVILLSGYAEFDYAQAAIKYNVRDYITKPTNFADLKNTLLGISASLDSSKKNNINAFFDNIKQLYADILSGSIADAKNTFDVLLTGYSHGNEHLGQYVSNIFETVEDKLYVNLKVQISSEEYDYKKIALLNSYEDIYALSMRLLENAVNHVPSKDGAAPNDIVISKLLKFVNDNFSENISLQDAAEVVFFNPSYCSRFFKEQTGENFSDYLLKIRMQHAVKLLKENKKINDISRECGYRSSGYFTRIFKEYYNCTPSEYLRNL